MPAPRPDRPVTINDIAALTGVAASTVSRALRNPAEGQRGDAGQDPGRRARTELPAQHSGPRAHLRPDRHHRGVRLRRDEPVLLRHPARHPAATQGGRLRPTADRHRGLRRPRDRDAVPDAPVTGRSHPGRVAAAGPDAHPVGRHRPAGHRQPQRRGSTQCGHRHPGRHRPGRRAPRLTRAPGRRLRLRTRQVMVERRPVAGRARCRRPARADVAAGRAVPSRPAVRHGRSGRGRSTPAPPPAWSSTTCSRSAC